MAKYVPRTVIDDRSATHLVTQARRHAIWPRPWDEAYRRTPLVWRLSQLGFMGVMLFMASRSLFLVQVPTSLDAALGCCVVPAVVVAFLLAFYRSMVPWSRAQQLDPTRCRACDYTLEKLTPDPDGCTTCPECGAAWRMPPPLPDA